jgi:hypothetical protein
MVDKSFSWSTYRNTFSWWVDKVRRKTK